MVYCKNNEYKLSSKYRKYFHDTGSFASIVLYWGYSKSCRFMKIWTVGRRHLTSSKFSFKGYLANKWGWCQSVSALGVQYLEGGCPGLMLVSTMLVSRGCAMRSRLSPARCRARCLVGVSCRVCSLNGGVPTRHVVVGRVLVR